MIKNFNLFSQRKRILALITLISFIFCALIVRLSVVQLINGSWLQTKAMDQWTRDLPLKAERGKIYDSTGSSLAVSYTTYNVYTRAREIIDPKQTATFLSNILNLNYESVYNKITNKTASEFLIKMQVEENIAKQIIDKNISGVYLSQNTKRYYPYGDLLTQILGFTTIDNIGQAGIELYYDNILKGTDGKSLIQADITGQQLDNTLSYYIPSIPGCNITLTIDSKIQLIVEQALNKVMTEQQAKSTTAIIMKANTGEIVAMSTKPSFDLNNVPRNDPSTLLETVKNKAVVDVYEPGSTFKILTMAATIEEGTANENSRFYCGGSCTVDGQKIKCWKSVGHGQQTFTDGFCNSCNSVFIDLALKLGLDTFYERVASFGLGQLTGIDFMGEASGILMQKENVKTVDLARMGFGQAIAVSPIQLVTALSATVNGGNLMSPYLVKEITDVTGQMVYSRSPSKVRTVIKSDVSAIIRGFLEEAVSRPLGKYTFIPGYCVGGKTGTTQKYINGAIGDSYIASFFGAFPCDNPEYVILFIVDEPTAGSYYGSIAASPYAKKVIEGIIEYYNYQPVADVEEPEEVLMPNLVGLSRTNAVSELIECGLGYEIGGDGSIVTEQFPPPNTSLKKGQIVQINTN